MEITTQIGCKNNCIYCPQDKFQKAYFNYFGKNETRLTLSTYKLLLGKIPKHVNIAFSGMSEPSFNADFIEMVKYTYESGYHIRINTTCQGLKKEDILSIKNMPFYSFDIHLPNESADISKIPSDEKHLVKLQWIENQNINNLKFRSVGSVNFKFKEVLKSAIYETKIYTRAGNLKKEKTVGFNIKKPKVLTRISQNRIQCSRVFNNIFNRNVLLPNGSVLICCMDYSLKHILGNLKTMTYDDLFNSSDYHRFTDNLVSGNNSICAHCEAAVSG